MSDPIILKTRDAVLLACVGGVCIGFGAFSIFHYVSSQKKNRSAKQQTKLNNLTIPLNYERSPAKVSRLHRHFSDQKLWLENMDDPISGDFPIAKIASFDEKFDELDSSDQLKALREQNYQLQNLLTIARTHKYDVSNPNTLSASDIETIRSIFDATDEDQDGCITDQGLIDIYQRLGEPLTNKEAHDIIAELDPNNTNKISFDTFLSWWHTQHKGGKRNRSYAHKFKFVFANIHKSDFDINKVIIKGVGQRATTEFRFTFHYEQKNGKLKQISPWHDIPLHHHKHKNIYNFICEIPKWTRAKYEISTGETFNPIHQDVKNGKLRFYQHGDMMFNYGALPQTWENPKHTPKDTGCPGDNDPLDVIEFGTKQLKTGSISPIKILGVLSLLDSNETDWKILAININDPLANLMNDVHDFEKIMPGAIHAIREYLRIYKVCTGSEQNSYAFRGEALNSEYALEVIEETHDEWMKLKEQKIQTV